MRPVLLMGMFSLAVALAAPDARAAVGPGAKDVKVAWAAGFPKVVGGKLKLSGTVTLANGWSSVDMKVNITVAPTAGGTAYPYQTALAANGTWSIDIDLATYPVPAQNYDITASVSVWQNGAGTIYPVTGPRDTRMLP